MKGAKIMSHTNETEHYNLPLYVGTDIINPLTDFNNANEAIDEALYDANQRSVSAENTAQEAKETAESYETRVTQAIDTANAASSLASNTQAMIADEFNPTKEGGYNIDDFVIYNGVLYRFINTHTGAWDASDVQVSPVLIDAISDVVDEGKQDIADAVTAAEEEIAGQTEKVTKTQAMIAEPFDENKDGGYAINEAVTYADKLYKFTSAHSGAWTGLDVEQINVVDNIEEVNSSLAKLFGGYELLKTQTITGSTSNVDITDYNEFVFGFYYNNTMFNPIYFNKSMINDDVTQFQSRVIIDGVESYAYAEFDSSVSTAMLHRQCVLYGR